MTQATTLPLTCTQNDFTTKQVSKINTFFSLCHQFYLVVISLCGALFHKKNCYHGLKDKRQNFSLKPKTHSFGGNDLFILFGRKEILHLAVRASDRPRQCDLVLAQCSASLLEVSQLDVMQCQAPKRLLMCNCHPLVLLVWEASVSGRHAPVVRAVLLTTAHPKLKDKGIQPLQSRSLGVLCSRCELSLSPLPL